MHLPGWPTYFWHTFLWRVRRLRWRVRRLLGASRVEATAARRRPRTPREVVFVSDYPVARELKMARGLRAVGWRVVLLHCRDLIVGGERVFDELVPYTEPDEAVERASRFSPTAFHVFVKWKYDVAVEFTRRRPAPVIVDTYDVLHGGIRPEFLDRHYPGQAAMERTALENADGLVCRSMATQYLKRDFGYRFRGPRILFPEYCELAQEAPIRPPPANGEIHVVECGGLALEKHRPGGPPCRCLLSVARPLIAQGVHYHIYPRQDHWLPHRRHLLHELIELARTNPYFHVHEPVPSEAIVRELSRYQIGFFFVSPELHFRGDHEYQLRPWFDTQLPNKITDYIEAGLVTLVHDGRFTRWWCEHYGIGVMAKPDMLTRPREWLASLLTDTEARAKRFHKAREALSLRRHIPRLTAFYESL